MLMMPISSFCLAAIVAIAGGDAPRIAVFRPDLSIVTETVTVDLPAGDSRLRVDFVRGNADLTTLQVFVLDHAGDVSIAGQTRRDELPNALFLEVNAKSSVRERLELRYVARGYAATPSYAVRFDVATTTVEFAQELEVSNDSGERLVDAHVDAMFGDVRTVGSQPVTHGRTADPQGAGGAGLPSQPLVKDAAEHTIVAFGDGVTLADGTSLRRRVAEKSGVPAAIEFRFRADESGGRVTRRAKIKNVADGGLGGSTLQPGRWTIAERDAAGGESFTGYADLGSIAPGADFELGLAVATDFFVERERLDHQRLDLVFGEYNRALVSFSESESWRLKVRNHSTEARTLVIHEVIGGTDTFEILEPTVPATRKDRNLVEFRLEVAAGSEAVLTYRVKKSNLRAG
jgi:hypothetical protein